MRGTIEQITTKSGENNKGPWKKWGIKIDTGQWLSTFDKALGSYLKEGQTYDFETEQKGNFLTITEAVLIKTGGPSGTAHTEPWPGDEPKPPAEAPKKGTVPIFKDNGHLRLGSEKLTPRERAMTLAIESYKGQAVGDIDLTARAEIILKWLEG